MRPGHGGQPGLVLDWVGGLGDQVSLLSVTRLRPAQIENLMP